MPEGDHEIAILFDVVLVPKAGRAQLRSVPESTSIDALDSKLLRRERSHRDRLSIHADGADITPTNLPPIVTNHGPVPLRPPLSLERLTPGRLLFFALIAATFLPIVLLCFVGLRRVGRGTALLIVPRCAACRSALHESARRCTECGRELGASHAVRALAFRTTVLRVSLVCLLTPIVALALLPATTSSFTFLDRWLGDVPREDANVMDRLAIETDRLGMRGADEAAIARIASLLDDLSGGAYAKPLQSLDQSRLQAILRRLLATLEERPNEDLDTDRLFIALGDMRGFRRYPDFDPALQEAFHRVLLRPISLTPLRHRSGTWSRIDVEDPNVHGPLHKLLSIEGMPERRVDDPGQHRFDEILVPDTPGSFEVTVRFGMTRESNYFLPTGRVILLESVAPGEPLAQHTTDPRRSPFRKLPVPEFHQVSDRPPRGRWIASLDLHQPPGSASALGSWRIESTHGIFPFESGEAFDPDLLGAPGSPVTLHFEPMSLDELDPDEAVTLWGAAESLRVTPVLRPLGWWEGE